MSALISSFPISTKLGEIHSFISKNESGAIIGPTAIGKSLAIPAYLAAQKKGIKIYISVPSLNVARSLKISQFQVNPGVSVSYAAIDFEPDENSQIVYATSEYVKNLLFDGIDGESIKKDNRISKIGILLIDEAHLTSFDNFIIYKLWKYYEEKNAPRPRLYLLSTGLNEYLYADFPIDKRLEIAVVSKGIDIKYSNVKYELSRRDTNRKYFEMVDMITIHHKYLSDNMGAFIVFLSGKSDVNIVANILKKAIDTKGIDNIEIIKVHSGLSKEDFNKIYQTTSKRKVILSTNVIESAVTIKNVIAIFDSMLEKYPIQSETFQLESAFISKASATQRAGRTGRDVPGICFRMCTREQYELFSDYRPVEIETVPLYRTLLKAVKINLFPWKILPNTSTIKERVKQSIKFMKSLSIIDVDNHISELGDFYLISNLSIRTTAILWWWLKSNTTNYYSGLVAIILINNYQEGYFNFDTDELRKIKLDEYKNIHFSKFRGDSDLHTYMNMWLSILPNIINKKINDYDILTEWSEKNKIDARKISFFYTILKSTIEKVNNLGLTMNPIVEFPYNTNDTIYQLMPILRKVYFDKELVESNGVYINDKTRYELKSDRQINNYDLIKPKRILSFYEIGFNNIPKVTFSVNIEPQDNRMFTLDILITSSLKIRIPKRAHMPNFVSKMKKSDINYPKIDWNILNFELNLDIELPEQNLIEIGTVFPYS